MNGSRSIDDWPWIFHDLKKKGKKILKKFPKPNYF